MRVRYSAGDGGAASDALQTFRVSLRASPCDLRRPMQCALAEGRHIVPTTRGGSRAEMHRKSQVDMSRSGLVEFRSRGGVRITSWR